MSSHEKALKKNKPKKEKYIPHGTRLKDGSYQDNRDSFAKKLDQHKIDRMKFM